MSEPLESTIERDEELLRTYQPGSLVYDEMKDPSGLLRPAWRRFLAHTGPLRDAELRRRWEKASHLIHENGVSYNVYGDPDGLTRPWQLSPLPVLIDATDWSELANGLAQRARLLDALLRDLYGPQHMLREGLFPPELVFGNPWFLRACRGVPVPSDVRLPLYAADILRDPEGRFRVVDDRTQVPSGVGYALENRILISSVLPEAFRACNVERLALFFRALRETLTRLAPHNRDNPRIVLLTPGPYNATYFEQAYLAQYLGYTLVNGGDLTVRDDRVYLKTLGGLQPIDVILRRVNDDFCDPLELRPESMLGVPGLVQALRAGTVALANPLGTGMLQTPALLPYLARLAPKLLGEALALEAVRTAWCGEPAQLREAESFFHDAIVKPTFAEGFVEPILTAPLGDAQRAELWARIVAQPRAYVVQERVAPSTTPVLDGDALTPRAVVMRCYGALARDEYMFMPGGLSRVASSAFGSEVSMQLGAGSKDTWVVSRSAVSNFSLLPPSNHRQPITRGGSDLPSRAADNLYWLGRYAERAEGLARLARVIAGRLADLAGQGDLDKSHEFVALLRALTAQTELLYAEPLPVDEAPTLEAATAQLVAAVFDEKRLGTLTSVVASTLRAGRLVRDRISLDTFRVLSSIDEELIAARRDVEGHPLGTLQDVLGGVVRSLAAFSGLALESMTRGQAFRFLDMGRRLERAMTLTTLLKAGLSRASEREGPLLEALLEVADSSMTYRRRYLATLQVPPVVDLLLTDDSNPRSVVFQISAISEHIAALPSRDGNGLRSAEQRLVLSVLRDLELADPEHLCERGPEGSLPELEAFLRDIATRVPALSDALSDSYLNHATVSRHLGQDRLGFRQGEFDGGGDP